MREQVTYGISDWEKWILSAIRKIRSQKQRPSVERICHAVRQHHPHSEEVIKDYLEQLVSSGIVVKVFNKGQNSYKDPGGVKQLRHLNLTKDSDLSKVILRATRELKEKDGSTLKSIEKYIQQSHCIELSEPDVDFASVIKFSAKRAVERGFVVLVGKLYKAVGNQDIPLEKPKCKKPKVETPAQLNETLSEEPINIEKVPKTPLVDKPEKPATVKSDKSLKSDKSDKVERKIRTPKTIIKKKRTSEKHNESAKVSHNIFFII